ncbi:hypothetical protein Cpir12675_003490 [Ceratocystis pirilliformis]|uniref:Uncharacterized protein n=1 Tax=Ceratocystis pirilliformis TaxID=259994 RepID=A0ABR3Z3H2_9PEZI
MKFLSALTLVLAPLAMAQEPSAAATSTPAPTTTCISTMTLTKTLTLVRTSHTASVYANGTYAASSTGFVSYTSATLSASNTGGTTGSTSVPETGAAGMLSPQGLLAGAAGLLAVALM